MKNRDIRSVENLLCDRHMFDIRWHVTSICNYDCAFCIQGSRQTHRAQAQGESAVLTAMRQDFKDTDVSVQPIYIRKYETHISPELMQTLFMHEEKHVLVTGNDGRVFQFQNIQALGAALEDVESFYPDGYTCDAGIRNIWVDAFGNVKRCPALGSTMSMGSLLDGSFKLYNAPAPCSSDHCSCSQYGRIEKPKE